MKFFSKIKTWNWGRIIVLFGGIGIIVVMIQSDTLVEKMSSSFKSIAEMPRLFYTINGITIFVSILHLFFVPKGGIAKEHLLYKRLGPILSTPLTCLTFGTFIYCGLLIIYLVCYDDATLIKYDKLDKTTVTFTMLALMTYAFNGIGLIIGDICNPKELPPGRMIPSQTENQNSE